MHNAFWQGCTTLLRCCVYLANKFVDCEIGMAANTCGGSEVYERAWGLVTVAEANYCPMDKITNLVLKCNRSVGSDFAWFAFFHGQLPTKPTDEVIYPTANNEQTRGRIQFVRACCDRRPQGFLVIS